MKIIVSRLKVLVRRGCLAAMALCAHIAVGDEAAVAYSPFANNEIPQAVYWGDTHIHTELSMDANSAGDRLSQEAAYRFAKGGTVVSSTGVPMRISRPLDFVLLADHAEFMGYFPLIREGNTKAGSSGWDKYFSSGNDIELLMTIVDLSLAEDMQSKSVELGLKQDPTVLGSVWGDIAALADRYNDPGRFTAFIGYEWTSSPRGDNLHRNVIFRDGSEFATRILPFSSMDSQNPEDLWKFMEKYEENTGGQVLAIPHNGNLSNGLMFRDKTYNGDALTQSYAQTRAQWEPLVEATQIKGDGESHPFLSPDDGFADFELWDSGNLADRVPKETRMFQYEYTRSALKLGLELESRLGVNPFKLGMIGSSDTHTSLGAVEENNFSGKFASLEPHPQRIGESSVPGDDDAPTGHATRYSASGYAAIWATENTREALFDAMQRKETYASTGPRIMVRFFGGWDFQDRDDRRSDYVAVGYKKGVPMGGDITLAPENAAPTFMVLASKDPLGAHLDRIQIVKGWLASDGSTHERVYDVALSDDREVDASGKVPVLEPTVDVRTATYVNNIGAPLLSTVWEDPEFDPSQRAFYYARIIEIPTPRWSTYEAALFGLELPKGEPAIIQERAYTSPIWYTPLIAQESGPAH